MRLPLALAVAALLALTPAAGAKPHKSCARKGTHTVKSTKLVRVFTRANDQGGKDLIGCLRSTDRAQLVTSSYDDNYVLSGAYDHLRVAGRFVAWQFTSTDISCKADCPPSYDPTTTALYVRDLRKRKTKAATGAIASDGGKLVLTRRGAIAWSEDDPFAIRALDGSGTRTLDSGDNLALRSLRLVNGNTARWLNGGKPQTSKLTPPKF